MANRAWRAGLISSLFLNLLFSGVAACLSGSQIRITVHNDARIPESVLTQAAGEASRIFQKAGVDSVWIVCPYSNAEQSAPQDCLSPADLSHVSLRVVPWSSQLGDSIFGMAFLSEKGEGAYGDVFYPSAEKLRSDCDASLSRVLGHVMAHEVGHLLLGSKSHSAVGIMQPHWQGEELRRVGMGTLLFTREQAQKMRARLVASNPTGSVFR
ncbi:MAG: hypothetical protein WAN03_03830 [Candidatus Sulfotelmatobacter sp.]